MSKIEQITAFINVVDENGFAAAARKVGLSTPSISRLVSLLEADLGVALLERHTRRLVLTEIGTEYYEQCKKTLFELSEAEAAIKQSQNAARGLLWVVSNPRLAEKIILPHLSTFLEENPELNFKLESVDRFPNFDKEEVDLLFGASMEGPPELVRRRIGESRYVLAASPAYLKKMGIPETPMELTRHRYITHMMRKPNNVITFKGETIIYLKPFLIMNDTKQMQECAIQGLGIINIHDYVIEDALKRGDLVEILKNYQDPKINLYVYYKQSRYLQPKIRRFIDFYEKYWMFEKE